MSISIKLEPQPPVCNQTLDNFINKHQFKLMGSVQTIRIIFFDYEIPQFNQFARCYKLYLKFLDPNIENDIVEYDIVGINKGSGHVKFKNPNKDYDFINSLLIKDGIIEKGNNQAIVVHFNQLGQFLVSQCFNIDGSELVKNKRIIVSGD